MTIDVADIFAAVILNLFGTGLLASYLLHKVQAAHETKLERMKGDLEARIRRLQTILDRSVLVHRVQFETEFAALRDIWAKLAAVRSSMAGVRPIAGIVPLEETAEDRLQREWANFTAFHSDFIEFVRAVDHQSPFISAEIYRRLEGAIQIARGEAIDVELHFNDRDGDPERDWYDRGNRNLQQFLDAVVDISTQIRARLESLSVVPGE